MHFMLQLKIICIRIKKINKYQVRIMTDVNKDKNKCKCPFCDAEIETKEMTFCEHCKVDIKVSYCKECGKPIPPEATVCPECGQS